MIKVHDSLLIKPRWSPRPRCNLLGFDCAVTIIVQRETILVQCFLNCSMWLKSAFTYVCFPHQSNKFSVGNFALYFITYVIMAHLLNWIIFIHLMLYYSTIMYMANSLVFDTALPLSDTREKKYSHVCYSKWISLLMMLLWAVLIRKLKMLQQIKMLQCKWRNISHGTPWHIGVFLKMWWWDTVSLILFIRNIMSFLLVSQISVTMN